MYLAAAGAPAQYLMVQAAALGIGGACLAISARVPWQPSERASGAILALLGLALLATAILAAPVEGAARWVKVGALFVQPSLVLLPPMLLLFARRPDGLATAGMAIAALALALQPDRAMAGAAAAALAVLAMRKPTRWTLAAAAAAAMAFVAALVQPDALPAVPFVDEILYTAFDVHPVVGAAVLAGSVLLLLPALGAGEADRRLVFGAAWLAIVAAAALGNYPTPLVGYGGSAVLGYLLSVALLPAAWRAEAVKASARHREHERAGGDETLRTAAA
ncbi:MAG TPA: hypothetical protein VGX37_02495 [Allosphingosinicella sp.]|nr:hypothetical protein [Allosphingosinicella sp.]